MEDISKFISIHNEQDNEEPEVISIHCDYFDKKEVVNITIIKTKHNDPSTPTKNTTTY